ncbi:4-alpha-glucanotransferase [Yersinia pseudotuberculosis]|uniref:4-alpha-glucanotransferase n=1 Tax=Yersinia pseudotuberculosis TaxID=633 RepID=UPI000BF2345D|nr:4-alpha-glucanotransferase [Yersinia pseudotuberculosis]AXY35336.1 4-alpha-glucanotransferase [Yersinia pseudotuberculosis]PEI14905.1 4-alpha-glucanotransferase [Yersinia pseudotuberculosis]
MDRKSLDQAATLAGIAASYINAHGKPQATLAETKEQLLAAMGRSLGAHDTQTANTPLPVVKVFTFGSPMQLPMAGSGDYHWQLQTENGELHQGRISAKKTLTLPASLPLGYHRLILEQDLQQWQCSIIVAPKRCYEPDALLQGKKLWGACVQLYTLRSEHNWGIGDFGDLKQMLEQVGERGGSFIGLNPIHALYPANPHSASPYSPSSRRWLNVIYIDINRVEEFQQSEAAQRWWHQAETQQALAKSRESEWVDYPLVMQLKLTALRLSFPLFTARKAKDAQVQAFRHFVEQGGSSLHQQAVFDALHAHLSEHDPMMWGWPVWPEKYRDGHSSAVADFCREHADEVTFYLWLQWLAASQFDDCFQSSQQRKMPIGLYRDLAVGVAEGGAETWCDRELYCLKASVGAPPDILGPLGQNWGLPPMDPHVMVARAYQPFIDLLRANMTSCGALRIDHVMALLRLWWFPYGHTADQGAYVKYPVDDLLAVLALESQRHHCMVIGEDLGTVPVEIVGKLRDSGVYSYKVLYFEHDSENIFRAPQSYPVQAMATITTHDLPTLRGYWQADDLTLGNKLGLYPDQQILKQLYLDRERAKQGLLEGLHRYDCVPKKVGHKAALLSMSPVLNRGLQRYVADSASALLGLQPEDWLDMAAPVNIPGTTDEYPNWRRKLSASLEEIFADSQINRLLKDLDKRRKNVSVG